MGFFLSGIRACIKKRNGERALQLCETAKATLGGKQVTFFCSFFLTATKKTHRRSDGCVVSLCNEGVRKKKHTHKSPFEFISIQLFNRPGHEKPRIQAVRGNAGQEICPLCAYAVDSAFRLSRRREESQSIVGGVEPGEGCALRY